MTMPKVYMVCLRKNSKESMKAERKHEKKYHSTILCSIKRQEKEIMNVDPTQNMYQSMNRRKI